MKNSIDITHKVDHVERILTMCAKYNQQIKAEKIDHEVFITAVIWHDVWKAQFGSNGFVRALYGQIMEGLLSAQLFYHYGISQNIDKTFLKKVVYVIRKHSQVQFLPRYTSEARLLGDMDKLDKWEPTRFVHIKDEFFATRTAFGRKLFTIYMKSDSDKKVYFSWLRPEFNLRKTKYFEEVGL